MLSRFLLIFLQSEVKNHGVTTDRYLSCCKLKTNERNMATIQDIHALEQRITDLVEDYIQKLYNEDDVLAIDHRWGKITLTVKDKEKIKVCKITEIYPLKEFVRADENGKQETEIERISDIANSLVFLN